jgi:hypothetical protein
MLVEAAFAASLAACGGGGVGEGQEQAQAQGETDAEAAGTMETVQSHRIITNSSKTTLTVTASKGGTISSKPSGIDCSTTTASGCSNTFYRGAVVTMAASVASGYKFAGWKGACSGTSDCVVSVGTSPITVSATFATLAGTPAPAPAPAPAPTPAPSPAPTPAPMPAPTPAPTPAPAPAPTPAPAPASAAGYQIGYSTCPAPASGGKTYTIGLLDSSKQASGPQTIAAFTGWNTLAAGDVVCIYGKSTAYAERLVLTRSGASAKPIRVVGVVQNGYEPVLTGKSATTAAAFNYGANLAENYEAGEISITGLDYGVPVSYLNVEGLTIQGATTAEVGGTAAKPTYSVNSYSDPSINNNAPAAWGCGSAGVNIIRADHVSLIHNRIKDNDNGIFVNSNNGNTSSNILISYNHIYGNGVFGEEQGAWNPGKCGLDSHGVYTEAKTIAFVGNRFGGPRQGEPTNLLKDRSAGLSISYNLFQPDGVLETKLGDGALVGAVAQPVGHILDLVESYDSSVGFYSLGAAYLNASVFGNVFFDDSAGANTNQGTTVPLHFGGDQGNASFYRTKLHFYNNTVVTRRDSSNSDGTLGWFELETGTNAEAWNNIFYASANKTTTASGFRLLNTYCYNAPCGTLSYGAQNWVSPIFGTTGVNGTATDPSFVSLSGNDVHLAAKNATIVGNGQLGDSAYATSATTMPLQYVDFLSSAARPFSASKIDLGAFGYRP